MGLFDPTESINLADPGTVPISDSVAAAVPDAGQYFLDWVGGLLGEEAHALLRSEIDSRRGANGWLAGKAFADVPGIGRKQTPLTFLSILTRGRSAIALSVWGTSARRGKGYSALGKTLESLVHTQGHAAAATWAIVARPEAKLLGLESLANSITESWAEDLSWVQNRDVIRALKNWQPIRPQASQPAPVARVHPSKTAYQGASSAPPRVTAITQGSTTDAPRSLNERPNYTSAPSWWRSSTSTRKAAAVVVAASAVFVGISLVNGPSSESSTPGPRSAAQAITTPTGAAGPTTTAAEATNSSELSQPAPSGGDDPVVPPSGAWIMVLESLPQGQYAFSEAQAMAEKLSASGNDIVVIDSSSTPGLNGGYWALSVSSFATKESAVTVCASFSRPVGGTCYPRLIG